jgi:hypothetical protein
VHNGGWAGWSKPTRLGHMQELGRETSTLPTVL